MENRENRGIARRSPRTCLVLGMQFHSEDDLFGTDEEGDHHEQ